MSSRIFKPRHIEKQHTSKRSQLLKNGSPWFADNRVSSANQQTLQRMADNRELASPQSEVIQCMYVRDGFRYTDDDSMAVRDQADVQEFYATPERVQEANHTLEDKGSQFRLRPQAAENGYRRVTAQAQGEGEQPHGADLEYSPLCNEISAGVMGGGGNRRELTTGMDIAEASNTGVDMAAMLSNFDAADPDAALAAVEARRAATATRPQQRQNVAHTIIRVNVDGWRRGVRQPKLDAMRQPIGQIVLASAGNMRFHFREPINSRYWQLVARDPVAAIADLEADPIVHEQSSDIEQLEEVQLAVGPLDLTAQGDADRADIQAYEALDGEDYITAIDGIKANEYANPGIGDAFAVFPMNPINGPALGFPYHWAGVIAKAGDDSVTFENYAGRGANQHYFQMYGQTTKMVNAEGEEGVPTAEQRYGTTFHKEWEGSFPDTHHVTIGVENAPQE